MGRQTLYFKIVNWNSALFLSSPLHILISKTTEFLQCEIEKLKNYSEISVTFLPYPERIKSCYKQTELLYQKNQ